MPEFCKPVAPIIVLTGEKGVGKTTIATILQTEYGFHRVRFADPFKDMLSCLGLTREHVDGRRKEEPLDLLCGKTPRYAMTTLGSEWRDMIGKSLWASVLVKRLQALPEIDHRHVVIDDLRFPHELDALNEAFPGRIHVIRVVSAGTPRLRVLRWLCRRKWGRWLCRALDLPMTEGEAWWPVFPVQGQIDNSSSLDALAQEVRRLLRETSVPASQTPNRIRCLPEKSHESP